jgi:transcriptional regulator with XRE-family HTH domain
MSVATIGSALAEKRRELGLEKGQAADKIGMSRTTYSSYEQDAQRPSVDVFPALTEFLEISMEELLTLYGATCVAAVRPSLERMLSDRTGDIGAAPISGAPTGLDVSAPNDEGGSSDDIGVDAETEGSSSEVVLELQEATNQPAAQDPLTTKEEEEVTADESEGSQPDAEDSSSEVALELHEETTESETLDPGPTPLPDLEGVGESHQLPASSEHHDETTEQMDLPSHSAELSVGSVVFEPSPYFIRTSLSESDAKNPDFKKKKKKKKKKK